MATQSRCCTPRSVGAGSSRRSPQLRPWSPRRSSIRCLSPLSITPACADMRLGFLAAFQFRASRRGDPMIAAIELLTQMYRENRRALPNKFPIGHLDEPAKKLILAGDKPDRPLYEVALAPQSAACGWAECASIIVACAAL